MKDKLVTLIVRLWLLIVAVFLFVDCLVNLVFCDGSLRTTMSANAWRNQHHKYWGWCYRAVNGVFFMQNNHCRRCAEREDRYQGNIWRAWSLDWYLA